MYYTCSGGTSSYSQIDKGGPLTCHSPVTSWHDSTRNTHLSQEARLSTPDDWRLRGIVGAYYEDFKIYDDMNFNYKTIPTCTAADLAAQVGGEPVCLGAVEPYPGSTANDPNPRGPNTAFGEDVQRGYTQTALFGSLDFDIIPKVLTVTAGTRWFQYKEFELGSVYTTGTGCENVLTCHASFPKHDIDAHNDHATFAGFKSRLGVTWNVTDDVMAYYLFSQGFRPGGFNRYNTNAVLKDASGNPQWVTPNSFRPDSLTNNEIGVKGFVLRSQSRAEPLRLRDALEQCAVPVLPAALHRQRDLRDQRSQLQHQRRRVQLHRPSDGRAHAVRALRPTTRIRKPACPASSATFRRAPPSGSASPKSAASHYPNPYGTVGGVAAFSPKWQGNIRARYDWDLMNYNAFAAVGMSYTGSMYNQPANYVSGNGVLIPSTTYLRYFQPSYVTFDAQFGVVKDQWTAQIFGENLGNSHASTFTSSAQWIKSEVPLRPRVIGLKVSYTY